MGNPQKLRCYNTYICFRFEEVRGRYERKESKQEDLNTISDLRQIITEQEKDLACINEEKRYFQMKLIQLDRLLQHQGIIEPEERPITNSSSSESPSDSSSMPSSNFSQSNVFTIPTTILECDNC